MSPIVEVGVPGADDGGEVQVKAASPRRSMPRRRSPDSEISFISVGTPSQRNGKLNLTHIRHVCADIGKALRQKRSFHWVVVRSTVLPGTTERVASCRRLKKRARA